MKMKEAILFLEERYPNSNASDFDVLNNGLTIGSLNDDIKNILLALDLTLEVVNEAIQNQANLIVCHHPFLFEPLKQIHFDTEIGQIIELMYQHRISLYTMHTNLDVALGGVNDALIHRLGVSNIHGEQGKDQFLRYGSIGPMTLIELTSHVKAKLEVTGVKVVGDLSRQISTLGVIGGSGGFIDAINLALYHKCDCLITSEIKLHIAQYANTHHLALIEVNHGVEKHVFENVRMELENRFKGKFRVYISKINTDPLIFM